ncbi:hypothetical protein ABNF97_04640 [Plantactinospora sp. B6F1]|uniref:hypothetical protein n=1 Tax=Plantactinospora sp. B6F1 TaxID=3158971 RepID=UPI00102BC7C2
MRHARRVEPRHRRAWWRLWRYCRCGQRWRCPEPAGVLPAPYRPPAPPVRALTLDAPPAPTRPRATNRRPGWDTPTHRPGWDAPTRAHLGNGRPGALTPGQGHRARHGVRA